MIIYHPRKDMYHCIFRLLNIARLQDLQEFDFIRLRIYDFFYLFPHLIQEISFPRIKGAADIKKQSAKFVIPYETLPDKKRLFSEMGDYHIQALQILIASGVFEEVNGKLRITNVFFSEPVENLLNKNKQDNNEFFSAFFNILNQIEISGEKGLKSRTGLMEYRYDAV